MVEILSGLVFGTIQGCMTGGISFIVSIADILISILYQILMAFGCTGVGGICYTIMSYVAMALGVLGLGGGGILGGGLGGGLGIIIDEIIVSIGTAFITLIRVMIDGIMGGLQTMGLF